MKKFMKILTKTLCLLFVVSFATLSFAGCGKKENNNNQASNTATTVVGGETNNSADNVNKDEETTTPEEPEMITLNGIYKLARAITYKDTFWTASNEDVFKFFETTDVNGVYNALRKLNFLDFANENIYEENGETYEYMVGFNGETFNGLIYNGYTYTIDESFPISAITSKIEIVDEDNFVLYAPYYYIENLEMIETPIFIKMPFTRVADSENTLIGTTYTYQAGSAKVELSNQSSMTEAEALLAVAKEFDIPTENVDIAATLELMFARFNVQIDANLTKATLLVTTDSTFTFFAITDATAFIDGVTISTTGRVVDLATGVETINFQVELDGNAIFTFQYKAV